MDARLFEETRRKAYQYARPMFWPNVGRQYLDSFRRAVAQHHKDSVQPFRESPSFSAKNSCEERLNRGK